LTKANKIFPLLDHETEAQDQGFRFIFGIDEAGRGPLAGPVVAAAVCLTSSGFSCPVNDSKKMTPVLRERAFHEIFEKAYVGIGIISEAAIDVVNILNASHLAMEAAVSDLISRMPSQMSSTEDFKKQVMLLVDGNRFRSDLPYRYKTIVGGDECCLSIACASIIAKVYRDRVMERYDRVFPQYGFGRHKGYPTSMHRETIRRYGPSLIHRRTFNMGE